jgi:uncharacterized protein involved in exopolysaccharide biosynthesis
VQNQSYSLQDLRGLIRRRGSLVGWSFLTVVLLSIVIAFSISNLYRSAGIIIIEQPEVSNSFLPGTYQISDRQQRIARVRDDVMTRDNLSQIVEKYDLYPEERAGGPASSVVSELRRNVNLQMITSEDDPRSRDSGEVIGFEVEYFNPDADTARNVARDVVELFLAVNRQRRQDAYVETAAALEREAENQRAEVSRLEGILADFKTEHPGALPEDRNYNRSVIERKARDLDGLDREIRSLQERKTLLQSQLAQTNPYLAGVGPNGEALPASADQIAGLNAEYLRLIGIYSSDHPDVQRVKRELDALSGEASGPALRYSLQSEVETRRAELETLRGQYGESHPDVVQLRRSLSALEDQLASMPVVSGAVPEPTNPTYINMQLNLQAVNTELAALRADRQQLQAQTVELDERVQIAPEVERRYLEITRDLNLARQQYEDTRSRQMDVERAGVLEEEELAERYVVTRMPYMPSRPAFPNRPLFVAIGVFLGITIGLGLGIGAEALDSTIRGTRDVSMIVGAPPIVAIPSIYTAAERVILSRRRILSIFLALSLIAAVAIYVGVTEVA